MSREGIKMFYFDNIFHINDVYKLYDLIYSFSSFTHHIMKIFAKTNRRVV
jgi:hypothetical protein